MKLIVQSLLRSWFFAFPIGYRLSRGWSLIPNRSRCGLTRRTWWMESFIRYGWRNFFFFLLSPCLLSSPLLSLPSLPIDLSSSTPIVTAKLDLLQLSIRLFHVFFLSPGFSIVFLSSTVGNPIAEKRNIPPPPLFFQFESFKVIT